MADAKFNLEMLDGTVGTYEEVRAAIRTRVPEYIMFGESEKAIVFHALNVFSLGVAAPRFDDDAEIARCCRTIMTAMETPDLHESMNDDSVISLFWRHVVGLWRLPRVAREQLHREIHEDLLVLSNLIENYSNTESVSALLEGHSPIRKHLARRDATFYVRCIKEQRRLISRFEDVNQRALVMSDEETHTVGQMLGLPLWDSFHPYEGRVSDSRRISRFDVRKIDRVSHRLGAVPVRVGAELRRLYKSGNWAAFYQKLAVYESPKRVFLSMLREVRSREALRHLSPTVTELRSLFYSKKYRGFYALALPQIEGVVTVMLRALGRSEGQSLTDKILKLWDRDDLASRSFDYFAWCLPEHRNKFAHAGILPGEPRWAAYDLLYDLGYLIAMYGNIDAPSIRLESLLQRREVNKLPDVNWFNQAFECFSDMKGEKEIPSAFNAFAEDVRGKRSELDRLVQGVEQQFVKELPDFVATFNALAAEVVPGFDIARKRTSDIRAKKGQLAEILKGEGLVDPNYVIVSFVRLIRGLHRYMDVEYKPAVSEWRALVENFVFLGVLEKGA